MRKFSWNKILNLSMIIATTLMLACLLCLPNFYKSHDEVNAEALIEGIPFRVGIMERTSTHMKDDNFVYSGDSSFWNGGLTTIGDGDFVMLENYKAEKILSGASQNSEKIKNIFINFGQLDTPYYLISITPKLKVNGEEIELPRATPQTHPAGFLPKNNTTSYYWYTYFDGKPLKDINGNTVSGMGLYEFTFSYTYAIEDIDVSPVKQYSFSFYLIDQSSYDEYPQFVNTEEGYKDSRNVRQFYHNYTVSELPHISFDASKYNISYTKEKNKDGEVVKSEFTVDPTTMLGTLTFKKTDPSNIDPKDETKYVDESKVKIEKIENIAKVGDKYPVLLYFDELGTYSISIKYLLQHGLVEEPEYIVVDNIPSYDLNTTFYDETDAYGNPVTNPALKGELKLHIFGVKALFARDGGTELKYKENNNVITQADVTHKIYAVASNTETFVKNLATGIYSKTEIETGVANPLIGFTNFPETNIVPIDFDYYSTFSYDGNRPLSTYKVYSDPTFTTQIESGFITKDSNLDTPGYYEVVVKYTYDRYTTTTPGAKIGNEIMHYQVFLFKISNTPPEVTLYKIDETSDDTVEDQQIEANILKNGSYTNQSVSVKWPEATYFQAPITAKYTRYNFGSGTPVITEALFEQGTVVGGGVNGNYFIRIYHSYSKDVYVEHSFTIDKDPITDYKIEPIYARKEANSSKIIGYGLVTDPNEATFFEDEEQTIPLKVINQPFTLTYPEKDSGAPITTKYYKIPFASNTNAGYTQTAGGKTYIDTDYQIDPANMVSGGTYNLDYVSIANGLVSSNNAFIDQKSFIYYFEITDAAGNTASTYIIYDLTKPYIVIDADASTAAIDSIDNPYGIVTKEASITWGNYKAIKVNAQLVEEKLENKLLQTIVETETTLFKKLGDVYYLCLPIDTVEFTQGPNKRTLSGSTYSSVSIYPTAEDSDSDFKKFFSGDDKIYSFVVTDKSNIKSLTNLAQNNKINGFVRMFLDNAQGIAYGNYSTNLDINTFNTYEDLLPGTTSANQLRFTYLPGTQNSGYYVKEVSYTYYAFEPTAYTAIDIDGYIADYTAKIEGGIPAPIYPFAKKATVSDKVLKPSQFEKRKGSGSNEEQDCVVTEIINPGSENGVVVTKPGMYVIKRVYEESQTTPADYSLDGLVRYYTYFVDRDKIIDINSGISDSNIYQDDRNEMLYETGSGILFNFSNKDINGKYETVYTALQIQQFLNVSKTNLKVFTSNKLPINFYLPYDKYNTRFVLSKADSSSSFTSYITNAYTTNNYNFALRCKLENLTQSGNSGEVKSTIVYDNTSGNIQYNASYFAQPELFVGYSGLNLKKEGVYTITFYDNSDSRTSQMTASKLPIDQQFNNSYKFEFEIVHEAPKGEYTSKYDDENRTDMLFNEKTENNKDGVTNFESFNNNALRFRFRKTDDQYKAEVDETKVVVKKKVGSSSAVTIFNSSTPNEEVLKFVPDTVDPDTGTDSSTGYYILTIFDEYDYKKEGKSYIGGSGTNRDYMLSTVQNIEYIVTLQYKGNSNDYVSDDNINYYTRDFKIILDRIKPQYNYQSIINLDNQKFAVNQTANTNVDKYFYTINKNFEFIQNKNLGGVLDSEVIFLRKLSGKSDTCDFPDYYKSFTPDDENYTADGYTNHIRFNESSVGSGDPATRFYAEYYDSTGKIKADNMFGRFGSYDEARGYYEIIERDQAGNYKVYAIYYNPDSVSNVIHFAYNPALPTDSDNGSLPIVDNGTNKYETEVLGTNLRFTSIEDLGLYKNDYFYKCIIQFNDEEPITRINNPNDRNDSNSWTDFLNLINKDLEKANTPTKEGYRITITFINRLSENYTITYRVPGERLAPIWDPADQGSIDSRGQFTITIPYDTDSTYIKEFHVWLFTNGEWIEQSQDTTGKTILKSFATGSSLQGHTYTFGLGEYKFQLIDIFERGRDLEEYPPYYMGVGVDDERTFSYGTSISVDGVTHTANNVSMKYQTNLYLLSIYALDSETGTYVQVQEKDFLLYGITEQSLTNKGVRTLIFQNSIKDSVKQFKVVLEVEKTKTEYVYEFAINKTLPEIVLRNQSGGKLITSYIETEPTIHTENFHITWDTNNVYTSYITLIRTYVDSNGKQQSQTLGNISNGYEISLPGTYTAKISNNLNYTDAAHNIYFKLVSGEIVVYDVVQINNGIETILHPSPKSSTIEVNGTNKILYSYYALSTYNNPTGSEKYIELRANKNKGIEYTLLNPEIEEIEEDDDIIDVTTVQKRIYKIYGASNYGYEKYIQIIFVDPNTNADGLSFTGITAFHPTENANTETQLTLSGEVTTNVDYIDLTWKAYNKTTLNYDELRGNLIYLDYYFNGKFVRTIYSESQDMNSLRISNAGIHKFRLYDLAGTQQMFGPSNEMVINLVNSVLFTVNGEEPVNCRVFNGDVIIELTNRHLYYTDPTVTAKMKGQEITPQRVGTSFYQYKFSEHGNYEVTITAQINQNETVTTTYYFTIINQKIALLCFSTPQDANFKVVKVLKQNADITHTLESLNELFLSPGTLGTGLYTVTLSQWNDALNADIEFDFQVWINDEIPLIYSDLAFGDSSTKNITLTFNPKIIYDQIGEGYISITGEPNIAITADSVNEVTSYTLTGNRVYYIQIYTADGNRINSYKVTKEEPLNTTSIIIIVVVSVVVVGLAVVFIVIRKHLKFR